MAHIIRDISFNWADFSCEYHRRIGTTKQGVESLVKSNGVVLLRDGTKCARIATV
jgi:hypothetical protein